MSIEDDIDRIERKRPDGSRERIDPGTCTFEFPK